MDEFRKAANEIDDRIKAELAKDEAKYDPLQAAKNTMEVLESALLTLREAKPDERSETARRYAVTITDMEKIVAYFRMYVAEDND